MKVGLRKTHRERERERERESGTAASGAHSDQLLDRNNEMSNHSINTPTRWFS